MNSVKFGLINCNDDDLIMVSDLDEIPNPEVVKDIVNKKLVDHCVMQDCYYYYINTLAHTNWYGNYIVEYKRTKDVSLTHLRNERVNYKLLNNAGWHLSFMGGPERVKNKIKSYAHQEYNFDNVLNQVENNMNLNRDIFGRGAYNNKIQEFYFGSMKNINIDNTYPEKMIKLIKTKYNYLIK